MVESVNVYLMACIKESAVRLVCSAGVFFGRVNVLFAQSGC